MPDSPIDVVFLCWGNICRSPMAERVARMHAAGEEGLAGVRFSSAGTSSEELGAPMDPRAAATLRRAGYDPDGHVAHQISAAEARSAALIVAMEPLHVERLERIAGKTGNVRLLTDFDPQAAPGSGVPDPWYGGPEGFVTTLASIEAAMPGVLAQARRLATRRH